MENFTNDTIDTKQLPKFEEVVFTSLHLKYLRVVIINLVIFCASLILFFGFFSYYNKELFSGRIWLIIGIMLSMFCLFVTFVSIAGFYKKGYAFREHDVLYKFGLISNNTVVIPYNRIQHVALHESLVSRIFDLAKIQIFTAGGSSSDIEIPGIEKEQAEKIKQLLMGKIQKQL